MPDVTNPQLQSILADLQSATARLLESGISSLPEAPARAILRQLEQQHAQLSVSIATDPFRVHVYFVAAAPEGETAPVPLLLFGFDSAERERIQFVEPGAGAVN